MKQLILILFVLFASTFCEANNKVYSNNFDDAIYGYDEYLEYNTEYADTLATLAIPAVIMEAIKKGVKKVIKALDLVMQRFQKAFLRLQTIMEKVRNQMSKLKLDKITKFVREKKEIFDKYYNELWTLKAKIDEIKGIKKAVESQAKLIANFNTIYKLFQNDHYLNPKELIVIKEVYWGMLQKNVEEIESLAILITDNKVQMQDGERLEMIKKVLDKLGKIGTDFNSFTGKIKSLSMSRASEVGQLDIVKQYYNIE